MEINHNEILIKIQNENRLPPSLKKYIVYGCNKKVENRLMVTLNKNYEYTVKLMADLITLTSNILGVTEEETFVNTDIHEHDQEYLRLNRAFGEMRIVCYLSKLGFKKIKLIKAESNTSDCDILASRKKTKYVIDVSTSTDLEYYFVIPREYRFENRTSIINKLEGVYNSKKHQLENALSRHKSQRMILAIILDEINALTALSDQKEFDTISRQLFSELTYKRKCGLILQMKELRSYNKQFNWVNRLFHR